MFQDFKVGHTNTGPIARIQIQERKAIRFAYIEHEGDYGAISFEKDIRALYGWAKASRVRPGFYPLGVFHDSPDRTPSQACRSEIGIPFSGHAEPGEGIKIRDLPSMKVAALSFAGPASKYREAYRELSEWISKNRYEWVGPSIETYTRKPETVGGETIIHTKIEAPIRKK